MTYFISFYPVRPPNSRVFFLAYLTISSGSWKNLCNLYVRVRKIKQGGIIMWARRETHEQNRNEYKNFSKKCYFLPEWSSSFSNSFLTCRIPRLWVELMPVHQLRHYFLNKHSDGRERETKSRRTLGTVGWRWMDEERVRQMNRKR